MSFILKIVATEKWIENYFYRGLTSGHFLSLEKYKLATVTENNVEIEIVHIFLVEVKQKISF